MPPEERSQLEEQCSSLRRELKTWEKGFANANGSRKATRDEIKANPGIASKYKEYNKLRDILSGRRQKDAPAAPSSPRPKERKRKVQDVEESQHVETPRKRQHTTPRKKERPAVDILDMYDSPHQLDILFTPTKKQWISPTPQKNGKYLGLFDTLEDDENATPGKDRKGPLGDALLHATPSRKTSVHFDGTRKHSRTPTSSSRRNVLDRSTLTTPLRPRNGSGPDGARTTPGSGVSKLYFPTPSFLRRDNRMSVADGADPTSPPMVRGPRKMFGRGLSSMLAGLRKIAEEAEDEDLEALREMENESASTVKSKPKTKNDASVLEPETEVQVEDSQISHLLGGFDDESKFDSEPETTNRDGGEMVGKDGKALKAYKKKGQKRTTRRINIRPTAPQKALPHDVGRNLDSPSPPASPSLRGNSPGELHGGETTTIPETQSYSGDGDDIPDIDQKSGIVPFNSDNLDYPGQDDDEEEDSGSDYTASSGGTRYRKPDQSAHLARVAERRRALKVNSTSAEVGKDAVVSNVRKGVRKVTALAAQNFKRLKLRGKGAKGGGGGGKRFGRKR